MTQTRRSTAEVRAEILRHATAEFSATGYPQTTTRVIAARAGVSTSVLYRHFETKEELFTASVVGPFTGFLEQFAKSWQGQLDAPFDEERMIEEFVQDFRAALEPQRDALVALVALHEAPNAAVIEVLRRSMATVIEDISRIAEHEAVLRNRGPEMSAQRVLLAMCLLTGEMLMRPLLPDVWATDSPKDRDRAMNNAFTGLLLHGLRLIAPPERL